MRYLFAGLALGVAMTTLTALEDRSYAAKRRKAEQVDPLALARVLLRDGLPERALAILAEAAPERGVEELHRIRGLALHELGRHAEAAAAFARALELGEQGEATWFALASAQLAAGDAAGALASCERAPPELWSLPGAFRLRAAALYARGDRHGAFIALDAGAARFPADLELQRQRVRILLELGLHQEGLEAARSLLERPELGVKDHLAFAAALAGSRQLEQAILLLEGALLRFPEEAEVRRQLARTYFEAERPLSAAELLLPLAHDDPTAALHAAELYRRAGKAERALRMNGSVVDPKEKVRQRLNLLIELERYEEAAALDERLARLGLLEEQRLAYALAYAHYRAGNRARAEAILGRLSEPELFAKATAIRRALEACDRDVWQCE